MDHPGTPNHHTQTSRSSIAPYISDNVRQIIEDPLCGQWLDLDRLLAHFWESRSVRTEVVYIGPMEEKEANERMGHSLQ